jgi:hypothetical protein
MFCKLCKEESSATDSVTDVTDVRKNEEGSSATDSVTDVTDVTDIRKKEDRRGMGVNLTSKVVPIYCLTMIAPIP